jgi:hypothetical protein
MDIARVKKQKGRIAMSSRQFSLTEALLNQGITPGTPGNRHEPDVNGIQQIISDRQNGSPTAVSPTGEIISERDAAYKRLCEVDPDFMAKMQKLSDMKITF